MSKRDKDFLNNVDSDVVENDFDNVDPYGDKVEEEERSHNFDNIIAE